MGEFQYNFSTKLNPTLPPPLQDHKEKSKNFHIHEFLSIISLNSHQQISHEFMHEHQAHRHRKNATYMNNVKTIKSLKPRFIFDPFEEFMRKSLKKKMELNSMHSHGVSIH